MKIALISDIHANLPALEAVLSDIDKQKPDSVYCLGDLVGYNVWANEVINMIRSRDIPTLYGNYDYGIGINGNDCGCAYKTEDEKSNGAVSISYTNEIIGADERAYLHALPANIPIVLPAVERDINLLLVHGSPRRVNEYLFEDRDEKSLLRILEHADADILCFGHTHKPFHRKLSYEVDNETYNRHAINTGSVGKPKDKDPRACYVILEYDEHLSIKNPDTLKVHFIRVEYDTERAAKAIENSRLPNAYADALRKAE